MLTQLCTAAADEGDAAAEGRVEAPASNAFESPLQQKQPVVGGAAAAAAASTPPAQDGAAVTGTDANDQQQKAIARGGGPPRKLRTMGEALKFFGLKTEAVQGMIQKLPGYKDCTQRPPAAKKARKGEATPASVQQAGDE